MAKIKFNARPASRTPVKSVAAVRAKPTAPPAKIKQNSTISATAKLSAKMEDERYLLLCSRLVSLHRYLADIYLAGVRGKDVGLPKDRWFGKAAPEHVVKASEVFAKEISKSIKAWLFAIHNHWQADNPKINIPKEANSELTF